MRQVSAALVLACVTAGSYGQSMSWFTYAPGTGEYVNLAGVSPDGAAFTVHACCNTGADVTWAYLFRPGTGYSVIASVQRSGPGCCGAVAAGAVSGAGGHALSRISNFSSVCNCYVTNSYRYPSTNLGALPNAPHTSTFTSAMSDDGSVVVGTSLTVSGYHAFRWTAAAGMTDLGLAAADDTGSNAMAVSGDGGTIVGTSTGAGAVTLFRWTGASGLVPLATLPLDSAQHFMGAGAESATFVGYSVVGGHNIPFRWTEGGGMQTLPQITGRADATPTAVSADGTKVVGYCGPESALGSGGAFLWSPTSGAVDLQVYMQSLGVDFGLPMTYLVAATAISRDGLHIGGNGAALFDRRVWIAHLPTPCGSADFNCDGDSGTDADIEAFFLCLSGTCPGAPCGSTADFNHDGDSATDADIEAFFRVLAGGAC